MPLKAVVDTNIFVSASILRRGAPHELLAAWEHRRFDLLMSARQRQEIERTLKRAKFTDCGVTLRQVTGLLNRIDGQATIVAELTDLSVAVRDAKDQMVLATALGGGADFLVTGDDDLLVLDGDPRLGKLRIVTARAFLDVLAVMGEEPDRPPQE